MHAVQVLGHLGWAVENTSLLVFFFLAVGHLLLDRSGFKASDYLFAPCLPARRV
jgi:hypothetical protein